MSRSNPSGRPLLDKLGVKPGARVSLVGMRDQAFVADLATRTGDVHAGPRPDSDLIFIYVRDRDDLDQALAGLEEFLKRNGAIWVVRPKGIPEIKETDVIEAGKRAGLVDNKIASFSDELSAMRLVIPLSRR